MDYKRYDGEPFIAYFVRLFEHKEEYGLTCEQIAALLNVESNSNFGECKWRKEYAAFNRGREYERAYGSIGVANRVLCLSDMHVPFELPASTFHEYAGKVDVLVLNGDIGDCQAISKFPKTYRVSPMEELILTRQYLIGLIELLSPKKVVAVYGNHDIRFQNYFAKNLDSDLLELMPKTSLELIFVDGFKHYNKRERTKVEYKPLAEVFDDIEIEYVDNWYTQIGDTIFCHPLTFANGIMQTANKAVEYFRNSGEVFKNLVMAHTHKVGSYMVGDTMMYEQGCCCDVEKIHYADGKLTPSQKEGFLYICMDSDGKLLRDQTRLVCLN